MPSGINMRWKDSHLYVRLTGEPKLESMKQQLEKMLKSCIQHHCSKILVNATQLDGLLSVLDRYQLGAFLDKMWDRDVRIAMVVPAEELIEHKFFETVVRNRGVLIETFGNTKDAQKWLESCAHVN